MIKLAWRNIWRNRRRTALTSLGIAFAVAVLQFFNGIQLKSYDAAINASVSMFYGHLQIQRQGYLDHPEIRSHFKNYLRLLEEIRSNPNVTAATARGLGFALLSSEERTYGAQVVGVDPLSEPLVSSIPGVVKDGEFLASDEADEIVIGRTLAEDLKVNVGDAVTMLGQASDGTLAASILTVKGIFESGSRDLDRMIAEIPLLTFQRLFGVEAEVHSIVIRLRSSDAIQPVRNSLQQFISSVLPTENISVLSWDELLPGLRQSIELDMSFGWLFFYSLILVVTLSVANTLLMSVLERIREFGVMLSLGATQIRVVSLIFIEALLIATLGALIGSTFGATILTYFESVGFSVPGTEEILKIWNLPGRVYPEATFPVMIRSPLIIFGTTLISALYPAYKIFRLSPIEALNAR